MAPLFLGLGLIISTLAVVVGPQEGWSIGDSLYFGFITATSVGYGDLSPTKGWSKLLGLPSIIVRLVTGILIAVAVEAAGMTDDELAA